MIAAVRDGTAEMKAARLAFERGDTAEAMVGTSRAGSFEMTIVKALASVRAYVGAEQYMQLMREQVAQQREAERPRSHRRRPRRQRPDNPGLKALPAVIALAALWSPLKGAIAAKKVAMIKAAVVVSGAAVVPYGAYIAVQPYIRPAPAPQVHARHHATATASVSPVTASRAPSPVRHRHARVARAVVNGKASPAPSAPPGPSLVPSVPVVAVSPSPEPLTGIINVQQVSIVLRPSPEDPTMLMAEIDFRAVGGPAAWSAGLESVPAGADLSLSAEGGTLGPDDQGSVVVSMPLVQGLLAGSGVVEVCGQQVTVSWL
jgi:hypothetical protein